MPSKYSLSVVMPNYNDAVSIAAAINAILNQSLPPTEVIVVDDGSTDDSAAIVETLMGSNRTVRLLRNDANKGITFSMKRGLENASGDFVYFASANDRILPGFFEKCVSLLIEYPHSGLCCSDFAIYYNLQTYFVRNLGWGTTPCYHSPKQLCKIIAKRGEYIPGAATIIRRSALLEAGGFVPELKGHGDWFAHLVIGFRRGICYVPEALAAWRAGIPGSARSTRLAGRLGGHGESSSRSDAKGGRVTGLPGTQEPGPRFSTMAAPNSEHLRSVAPDICRSRS